MMIDRADEMAQVDLAGQWLRQLTFYKSSLRAGQRADAPPEPCTAKVEVLSRAVMRAAAGRSQGSLQAGCAAKRQVSACNLRTYLAVSGDFFSAFTTVALRGGSHSRFAKADPRCTGTINEQGVQALIYQLLTLPVDGDESSEEEDEAETDARERATASGRMRKLLDQRTQTRQKIHQQWQRQDSIVIANVQAAERAKQRRQEDLARQREEEEQIKKEGQALAELELEIKQTESEQQHYYNQVQQEQVQHQVQQNAERKIKHKVSAETAFKRKFLAGREKDRRRAVKETQRYISGHSRPSCNPQVAARNHRQLALLEEKLGDLQRSQMEAKAAERARDAKTQQILLGAMYASSKEAATEQLNKADNLRVSLQGCMQGEFQAGALSSAPAAFDEPLSAEELQELQKLQELQELQELDSREFINPEDHQFTGSAPDDEVYSQLRFATSKTTLQPVDELLEEDFGTSGAPLSAVLSDGTSTQESVLESSSTQESVASDKCGELYANAPVWYSQAKSTPELILQASIHEALGEAPPLGNAKRRPKASRPRSSQARVNFKPPQGRPRPNTALGYQNTAPEPSSWKRGAVCVRDQVSERMEQILHNENWSSRIQGECTKQWSAARKRWAWVPVKPDHLKRDHKAQGRHGLRHGFVLDSVSTNKGWEPIALRENSLLRVG